MNKAGGALSKKDDILASICKQLRVPTSDGKNPTLERVKQRFCTLFRLFVLRKLPGEYTPFIIPDRNLEHGEFMRQLQMNAAGEDQNFASRCPSVGIRAHCDDGRVTTVAEIAKLMPHQIFITRYFTVSNPCKGLLVWHSLGSGKTCSIISAATSSFLLSGWMVVWVTRISLKEDIYKNMYKTVCHFLYRELIKAGIIKMPPASDKKALSRLKTSWRKFFSTRFLDPLSYHQFELFAKKKWPQLRELRNAAQQGDSLFSKLARFQLERQEKGEKGEFFPDGTVDLLSHVIVIVAEVHRLVARPGEAAALDPNEFVSTGLLKIRERFYQSDKASGINSCKRVFLTASPICSHPVELFRLLNFLIDGTKISPFLKRKMNSIENGSMSRDRLHLKRPMNLDSELRD